MSYVIPENGHANIVAPFSECCTVGQSGPDEICATVGGIKLTGISKAKRVLPNAVSDF